MGRLVGWIVAAAILLAPCRAALPPHAHQRLPPAPGNLLAPAQRRRVDRAVDRALANLVGRQQPDGSFPTRPQAQPAVTALCAQALLARGHLPGAGPYGRSLDKAIGYMLSCQRPDGLLARLRPGPRLVRTRPSHTDTYNHAITGVVLCEVYGMTDAQTSARIRTAIENALVFTRRLQIRHKRDPDDRGGWKYLRRHANGDSDLCVTSWHLMFLRAAQNAGFHVPAEQIDEAMGFLRRCYFPRQGTFNYSQPNWRYYRITTAMAGSGVLSFALAGRHNSQMAQSAGQWILRTDFDNSRRNRFFYGGYYCSQAMFQLGGEYWRRFYPRLSRTLLACQHRDGSWGPETWVDRMWGKPYATALGAQCLMVPYQLLPIYQR